jgi:transaldolase/glucose-6-phosphate isomerase
MNPIQQTLKLGQSLWYDNIQRKLLENGELAAMIQRGDIRGVTSNPSIFQNAIGKSNDYDSALTPLAWSGWDAEQIFWQLAIEDIRAAADLFRPLYDQTGGADGYVSLEVSPYLAHDTDKTIQQARELWARVDRPNLMIKIPATKAGIPAIRRAIAEGININVTLIFSLMRYAEVMDAYLGGLEDRRAAGLEIDRVASVASFFVSRVDTKIDPRLPEGSPLRGKAAIANAKLAYADFIQNFGSQRFGELQKSAALMQRPLWASTSTKNPAYPDTIYIDNLIGPATVNTVPPATLDAFRDHGLAASTLTQGVDACRDQIAALEQVGISMVQVTQELEDEGVKAFADAFTSLLKTIDDRRKSALDQLGPLAAAVSKRVAQLESDAVSKRMHAIDPTVWTDDPIGQAEIKIRLGWLKSPQTSQNDLPAINASADEIKQAGIKNILLLGMGGSSLAPEVMSLIFSPHREGGFAILDSTDPAQVIATAKNFPPESSLYIVSSKSGGTAEVNAYFNYFWQLTKADGARFVAITDPGTALEKMAREKNFRRIFLSDPTVGGRYSVLTPFGLAPAALIGIDPGRLLARAAWMARQCADDLPAARNPGLVLGAIIGQAALDGRDKLTLIADPPLASFGSWLEQLIAESSGKQGRGIVVVDGEPIGQPPDYGDDRLFVYFRSTGDYDVAVKTLREAGRPVLEFPFAAFDALGSEFYRWEFATAIACAVLKVNPFDQPDVQDSKDRTKAKIAEFQAKGKLEMGKLVSLENASSALKDFLAQAKPGDYIAINAYLPRSDAAYAVLNDLRLAIRARTGCAVMVGFGPRFLHSTGQLHKGGAGGLFLQITADPVADLDIPTQGMSFGTLERAQALGDYESLAARGKPVLRVHLPSPEKVEAFVERIK